MERRPAIIAPELLEKGGGAIAAPCGTGEKDVSAH